MTDNLIFYPFVAQPTACYLPAYYFRAGWEQIGWHSVRCCPARKAANGMTINTHQKRHNIIIYVIYGVTRPFLGYSICHLTQMTRPICWLCALHVPGHSSFCFLLPSFCVKKKREREKKKKMSVGIFRSLKQNVYAQSENANRFQPDLKPRFFRASRE